MPLRLANPAICHSAAQANPTSSKNAAGKTWFEFLREFYPLVAQRRELQSMRPLKCKERGLFDESQRPSHNDRSGPSFGAAGRCAGGLFLARRRNAIGVIEGTQP
jgi:hypothetical protein